MYGLWADDPTRRESRRRLSRTPVRRLRRGTSRTSERPRTPQRPDRHGGRARRTTRRRRGSGRSSDRPADHERPRGGPLPGPAAPEGAPDPSPPAGWPRRRLAGGAAAHLRCVRVGLRARLGLRATRPDHGGLRAQRRRRDRRRLLLPLLPDPAQPVSTRMAALLGLLRDGGPRQRRLGLVRSRAPAGSAEPRPGRPLLPLLRPARHHRPPRARQAAGDQGGLGLPRPRLMADRGLAPHDLLEPRPRPHRTVPGARRRARGALARLPAPRHRAGQHGPGAALQTILGQPHRGEHGYRRARPDRHVRRAVHLAAAARELPIGPAAGRRLVRGLPAPRLRPLGRALAPAHGSRDGARARAGRDPRGRADHHPADRRIAGRPHAVSRRRRLHPGNSLQRAERAERRPRRALHGGHRRPRPRRPPGHHAPGQHHPHPGAGPEGEPLPLPGPGLQRRHHDRRPERHPAVREPGRRRGLRPRRRRARGLRTGLADTPRGPRPGRPRGAQVPRRQPRRGAHHPHRVPLPVGQRRLAERGIHRQPPPRRPHLQQQGRHRTGPPPGAAAAQRRARPAHRPAQPRAVHPERQPGPDRPQGDRPRHGRALHRPRRLQGRQRHHRPPGRRRTAHPGGAQTPGRGARGRHRLPARRRRVRGSHRRRRDQGPGRQGAAHLRTGRPAADHPLPALHHRRQRRTRRGLHRRRVRRTGHRRGRVAAQRRPRDVPRQGRGQGARRAVRPADAGRRRPQGAARHPTALRPARRRVRPAPPAGGLPRRRPDHRGRRTGPLALGPGHPLHARRVPAGVRGRARQRRRERQGERPRGRAGPLDARRGRQAGRRARALRARGPGDRPHERAPPAGPLHAPRLHRGAPDTARPALRGAHHRAGRQ